ncbi:MAG TPA: T9SS type A sorting domain-containing protein [Ignavibacteria bacterium]
MKKLIYTLAFVLILAQTILAQVNWSQSPGIYGGEVRCFAVASNGNTYMGSNGSGIYKTIDGGNNWTKVNTGILNLNVRAMAINSSDHIFAGILDSTGYGILRTTNNGVNWNYTALSNTDIRTIVINSSGHIFVGTDSTGIFRSTDNGVSFVQVNNGLTFRNIRSIAINSSGDLFAAAYTGGVFKSTDNGGNWTQVNTGLSNLYANSIAVNPVNGYLFVGTGNAVGSGAVYRSTNNGGIWTIMTLTNEWIIHIAINPTGVIYAGIIKLSYGSPLTYIKKSSDGGGTWDDIGAFGYYEGFTSLILNNTRVYAGTNYSLYRSVNDGSFDNLQNGFTGQVVNSLYIPNSIGHVLAATNWQGIYRTTDGGANWDNTYNGGVCKGFTVNSFGHIFTTYFSSYDNTSSVNKSTNGGQDWNQVGTINSPRLIQSLTVNLLDYVFAASAGDGIYRSINNGADFTQINLSNNYVWSLLSVDSTTSIFAGTGKGKIFRSTDYGFGWNQIYIRPDSTNNNVRSLAKSKTNILYAGLDTGGIIFSTNNGTTWTQSSFTVPNVNAIVFNSLNHIFAGTGNNGVYRSTDNGVSWTQVNNGFTNNNRINALAIDGAGFIYSGLNGGSVYKSLQSTTISIKNISSEIPSGYSLSQNYPNPFNPTTKIKFDVAPSLSFPNVSIGNPVTLKVYDVMGREVQTLVNEKLQPGTYETSFDGSQFSSGVYFYKLQTGDFSETKKMLMIK